MFAKLNHLAITSDHYTLLGMFYRAAFGLKASGDTAREIGAISVGDGYLGMTLIPRRGGRKAGLDHFGIEVADLDKVRAKHPDMVLLHGGSPRGAERIAACWADNRKVAQIAFKPDWNRHRNAAPFKRNDLMLEALPIGVIVFPGSGISANLADKARKMGIPVWRFSETGGA